MQRPIRVVLADDHELIRLGLKTILRGTGIDIVGEARDGNEAVALCRRLSPDVLTLDLRMPGLDGLAVAESLRADNSPVRVLVITTYETDEDVSRALRAGVRGYILKDAVADDVVLAVTTVASGGLHLAPSVTARFVASSIRPALTPRETEILRRMAEGRSNRQIAAALFIEETTVKTHLRSLYRKLGISSRVAALAEAARRGVIRPG